MKSFLQYLLEVKKPTGDLKTACWKGYTAVGMKMKNGRKVPNCVPEETQIDEARKVNTAAARTELANRSRKPLTGKDAEDKKKESDAAWERLMSHASSQGKTVKEETLDEVAAWQRKEGKNPEGGLNKKGVESYRRENPGSKLQTAVTTKPSKLKPGSKAANRRKSFCARMSGMKKRLTSAKTANDPDSRINKSLRKWNC